MIQRQLFDVGVDLILEPANLNNLIARASSGDFETLLPRVNAGRSLDFTYRFWHSSTDDSAAMCERGISAPMACLTNCEQVLGRRSADDRRPAWTKIPGRRACGVHRDGRQVTRAIDLA